MATTDPRVTIELLEAVFSVLSVLRRNNCYQLPLPVSTDCAAECLQAGRQLRVAVVRCEKLVAEAGDSLGTQRKGNIHSWMPLPSSTVNTVTENRSLCVIVICKV
jgi:hypothetical protein